MPHFFIKNENITNDLVIIDDKENYQHIARSLRAKIGEKILMVNENRIKIEGKIVEITKTEIKVIHRSMVIYNYVKSVINSLIGMVTSCSILILS